MEESFLFLSYHEVYPLREAGNKILKALLGFWLLNYVVMMASFFSHEIFASKSQKEVFQLYLLSLIEKDFTADDFKALNF